MWLAFLTFSASSWDEPFLGWNGRFCRGPFLRCDNTVFVHGTINSQSGSFKSFTWKLSESVCFIKREKASYQALSLHCCGLLVGFAVITKLCFHCLFLCFAWPLEVSRHFEVQTADQYSLCMFKLARETWQGLKNLIELQCLWIWGSWVYAYAHEIRVWSCIWFGKPCKYACMEMWSMHGKMGLLDKTERKQGVNAVKEWIWVHAGAALVGANACMKSGTA